MWVTWLNAASLEFGGRLVAPSPVQYVTRSPITCFNNLGDPRTLIRRPFFPGIEKNSRILLISYGRRTISTMTSSSNLRTHHSPNGPGEILTPSDCVNIEHIPTTDCRTLSARPHHLCMPRVLFFLRLQKLGVLGSYTPVGTP